MKITKVCIQKFRGFKNQKFEVGSLLTAIAGQNGTQKSTLLGILSQPFSLSSKHPMYGEKPLCGGTYRSAFSDKFRLSPKFDLPGEHEWTLYFDDSTDYSVKSVRRTGEGVKTALRFSHSEKKKGEGYIALPVIFLSLKRLIPTAEETTVKTNDDLLTDTEVELFKQLHNKILITNTPITSATNIVSAYKNSLGVNTEIYDWNQNSMGQDNLAKILLALFSFKRLKEKYPSDYKGGVLAIDEIDATMYPASQVELLKVLRKYASELKIQIIFTTHSLTLLRHMDELRQDSGKRVETKDQVKMIYLKKMDNDVQIKCDVSYDDIYLDLNVLAQGPDKKRKITTYVEDQETRDFLKAVLKSRFSQLDVVKATLSCSNLIDLVVRKVPAFNAPFALVVVDGDVLAMHGVRRLINKTNNVLVLPGGDSPEKVVAKFLNQLSDYDALWTTLPHGYNKQVCFRNFTYDQIMDDRERAKEWFRTQIAAGNWGSGGTKVFNALLSSMPDKINAFKADFEKKLKLFM